MAKRKIVLQKWHEVRLPAGDIQGFDVNGRGDWGSRRFDTPAGYHGIRFIGAGAGITRIRPDNVNQWHNSAVFVWPHNGPVEIIGATIHNGRDKAVHAGLATKSWNGTNYVVTRKVLPNARLMLTDCEIVAEKYGAGYRPKWGVFEYQTDVRLRRVKFHWWEGVEHASYEHGYARLGSEWDGVTVESSGAENDKTRNDSQEVQWVSTATIVRKNCRYANWYAPWTWRGGAAVVKQGTGVKLIHLKDCQFYGNAGLRGRCISIDDGGVRFDGRPDYYDAFTGEMGGVHANGDVLVEGCQMFGGPGDADYDDMMTFVNWHQRSGEYWHRVARRVDVKDCGVWGYHMLSKFSPTCPWTVTGCNTPEIRSRAASLGMHTSVEGMIAGNPLVPFSRGAQAAAVAP